MSWEEAINLHRGRSPTVAFASCHPPPSRGVGPVLEASPRVQAPELSGRQHSLLLALIIVKPYHRRFPAVEM